MWAHMGWLFVTMPGCEEYEEYCRFVKDLGRDPVQRFFDKYFFGVWVAFALVVYLAGELYGGLGASWLVWGVLVRQVILWHATWFVNSASHLWGYRNYNTDEESTNNWWVALLSFGEGWHNNHHADQRSAAHGQRWFEFDLTYWVIRLLGVLGLAWQIMEPRKSIVAKRMDIMVDDEALELADARAKSAILIKPSSKKLRTLQTQTDPTVPVEVPLMSSAAEAYEAAVKAAREAEEAAKTALRYAAEAIKHRQNGAIEKADQAVRELLEKGKDMGMAAVEQAKYAAAQASEFAAQAGTYAAEAKERASESARKFADQSRAIAQEAAEVAASAADEIAEAFKGIGRPIITSTI
jgi:hypothetical protein